MEDSSRPAGACAIRQERDGGSFGSFSRLVGHEAVEGSTDKRILIGEKIRKTESRTRLDLERNRNIDSDTVFENVTSVN